MSKVSRRAALGVMGVGVVAVAGYQMRGTGEAEPQPFARPEARTGENPVAEENRTTGSDSWVMGRDGTVTADDERVQIQGYASKVSVSPGESIGFHISSHKAQSCTVGIYRIGHYGGAGARHLLTSEPVDVEPRTKPGRGFEGVQRPPRSGRGLSEVFCESGLGRWRCRRWPARPSGCGVDGGRQGVDGEWWTASSKSW